MITLAIILGLTAITCTSLGVANAIDKRQRVDDEDPARVAIRSKVATLKERRKDLIRIHGSTYSSAEKDGAMQALKEVDNHLLRLADEEAKL